MSIFLLRSSIEIEATDEKEVEKIIENMKEGMKECILEYPLSAFDFLDSATIDLVKE